MPQSYMCYFVSVKCYRIFQNWEISFLIKSDGQNRYLSKIYSIFFFFFNSNLLRGKWNPLRFSRDNGSIHVLSQLEFMPKMGQMLISVCLELVCGWITHAMLPGPPADLPLQSWVRAAPLGLRAFPTNGPSLCLPASEGFALALG